MSYTLGLYKVLIGEYSILKCSRSLEQWRNLLQSQSQIIIEIWP